MNVGGDTVQLDSNKEYELFGSHTVKTTKVYLTFKEVDLLAKYDMSDYSDKDKIARMYFLVMCYTGLRVSDAIRLKSSHFITDESGQQFIRIFCYKGREVKEDTEVVIPVLPQLKELLDPIAYNLPRPIPKQTQNKRIKIIAADAGISRVGRYKSGEKGANVKVTAISSKITNHTGRYTFINMMLNDYGVTPFQLTKITGQSLDTLLGYERGDKKRNAEMVLAKVLP